MVQVLTFDQKRQWLYQKLAAIRSQHQGQSIAVTVARNQFLQQSCSTLLRASELMGDFAVGFEGEAGAGAGVRREWFQLTAREMFNPDNALFTPCAEGTFQPNPASHANPDHLSFFRFVGLVIGLAIYHQVCAARARYRYRARH
jgi:E3 ubiquitin-protein ligase HUWE1